MLCKCMDPVIFSHCYQIPTEYRIHNFRHSVKQHSCGVLTNAISDMYHVCTLREDIACFVLLLFYFFSSSVIPTQTHTHTELVRSAKYGQKQSHFVFLAFAVIYRWFRLICVCDWFICLLFGIPARKLERKSQSDHFLHSNTDPTSTQNFFI